MVRGRYHSRLIIPSRDRTGRVSAVFAFRACTKKAFRRLQKCHLCSPESTRSRKSPYILYYNIRRRPLVFITDTIRVWICKGIRRRFYIVIGVLLSRHVRRMIWWRAGSTIVGISNGRANSDLVEQVTFCPCTRMPVRSDTTRDSAAT